MRLEVEQKFRVVDSLAVAARLSERGTTLGPPEVQVDRYFNHPARDFAQTDEAVRIRQVGEANYLTYKGPKLDATTKTRREIEVAIAPGNAEAQQLAELLLALGFRPVAEVRKQRRKANVEHAGRAIEVVLDDINGVGTFVELECVVDERELVEAKRAIASLASELGLSQNERRSYLELLIAGLSAHLPAGSGS